MMILYYGKSVLMYKILNDHTMPNLKESFKKRSEYQNIYNLRNDILNSTSEAQKRIF